MIWTGGLSGEGGELWGGEMCKELTLEAVAELFVGPTFAVGGVENLRRGRAEGEFWHEL